MTEVMMGGAILAGVILAGARMFKDQKIAQKKVENEAALNTYHASLVKLMHNANNCNATLSNYYNASGTGAWASPSTIYTCTGCTSTTANYSANITTIPGRTAFAVAGTTYTDGARTWLVESFQIGAAHNALTTGPSATGKAVMRVTYRLNPNLPNGGRRVTKDINLNLRFTQAATPQFQECISGGESSVNNLSHDICSSMTQVSSSGTIMQWNDTTQSCEVVGSYASKVKECPSGTVLEGIRSDGSVRCKAVSSGVTPGQDLMLQSACPPGSTVKLEIVNGKIKTLCY